MCTNPKTQEIWQHVHMSCFAAILKKCQTFKDMIAIGTSYTDRAAFKRQSIISECKLKPSKHTQKPGVLKTLVQVVYQLFPLSHKNLNTPLVLHSSTKLQKQATFRNKN